MKHIEEIPCCGVSADARCAQEMSMSALQRRREGYVLLVETDVEGEWIRKGEMPRSEAEAIVKRQRR